MNSPDCNNRNDNSTKIHSVDNAALNVSKRPREENSTQPLKKLRDGNVSASSISKSTPGDTVVDIAQTINLQPGDRIEVQWDVQQEVVESEIVPPKQTRWWGATLLSHNGQCKVLSESDATECVSDKATVPQRVLDYDTFPEGGFQERSLEDVCFLTDHSLLNVKSNTRAYWRREGDAWSPPTNIDDEEETIMTEKSLSAANDISLGTSDEDIVRNVLNTVLQTALVKSGVQSKMKNILPSQQCVMAEKIANAKETLTQKLMAQLRSDDGNCIANVITPEHIKRCMEEVGHDLNL